MEAKRSPPPKVISLQSFIDSKTSHLQIQTENAKLGSAAMVFLSPQQSRSLQQDQHDILVRLIVLSEAWSSGLSRPFFKYSRLCRQIVEPASLNCDNCWCWRVLSCWSTPRFFQVKYEEIRKHKLASSRHNLINTTGKHYVREKATGIMLYASRLKHFEISLFLSKAWSVKLVIWEIVWEAER